MAEISPPEPEPVHGPADRPGNPRKMRGTRFPESEREEVKAAAARYDTPVAGFVRATILELARGRESPGARAGLATLAPLIERTFCYTWILVTRWRYELIAAGCGEEIEKPVEAASQGVAGIAASQRSEPGPSTDRGIHPSCRTT